MGLVGLAIVVLLFCLRRLRALDRHRRSHLPGSGAPPAAAQRRSLAGDRPHGPRYLFGLIYGSRVTLYIVVLVLVIAAPIGLLIGATAGYLGGRTDQVLMRITDIFFAFPRLVLALAFVASLGPGLNNAIIAIALTAWPAYARVARAETLAVRRSDFIAAITTQGAGQLAHHLPPHHAAVAALGHRARHPRHGRASS